MCLYIYITTGITYENSIKFFNITRHVDTARLFADTYHVPGMLSHRVYGRNRWILLSFGTCPDAVCKKKNADNVDHRLLCRSTRWPSQCQMSIAVNCYRKCAHGPKTSRLSRHCCYCYYNTVVVFSLKFYRLVFTGVRFTRKFDGKNPIHFSSILSSPSWRLLRLFLLGVYYSRFGPSLFLLFATPSFRQNWKPTSFISTVRYTVLIFVYQKKNRRVH